MTLPQWIGALTGDVLSGYGWNVGGSLSELTRRLVEHRLQAAREVWLDELRRGQRDLTSIGQEDQLASILFRYQRAAVEGAARLNLRLLAAVATGQAQRGGFAADEFLAWADTLAALRREEVILLAVMKRTEKAMPAGLPERRAETWATDGKWAAVFDAVIPDPFDSEADVLAAAAGASRSGLVMPASGTISNPVSFVTTGRLDRLLELAPLADVLGRENLTRWNAPR